MYLKQSRYKNGKVYLSIVHGYWDSTAKQSRTETVKKLGYLHELEKEHDDPVAYFTTMAEMMDGERKATESITVTIDRKKQLERGKTNRKNYGYIVFSRIYHELGIDKFLGNARRHKKFEYNTDAIMRLLVYSRILFPGSKRNAALLKGRFFDKFDFTLDDVYNSLGHFNKISDDLQAHIHGRITGQYNRDTSVVYYDVTNYYFEIDMQDDFRKRGYSKEGRRKPLVQMGLLLDRNAIPISYKIFPGNTHDSQTLMPVLTGLKKKYGAGRIVVVADKGLNSGDNMAYNTLLGDGYIYSKSVRGASDDFKKWVVDDNGYREVSDKYRIKSVTVPDAPVSVSVEKAGKKNKKKDILMEQKWISFHSTKYAIRAKHKREETISKALRMVENPSKYKNAVDYGAAGYIKNIQIDKETGQINNTTEVLHLDFERIEEEEKYDGYYAIITSELDDPDEHIVELYHGLWQIEESFKITKSVLETRPVYLSLMEHINAHFLSCFIALLIVRIAELRLGNKYSAEKITDTLRSVACTHFEKNLWVFDHADEVTDDMNAAFGTDFGRQTLTLGEIRKNFGDTKKR